MAGGDIAFELELRHREDLGYQRANMFSGLRQDDAFTDKGVDSSFTEHREEVEGEGGNGGLVLVQ